MQDERTLRQALEDTYRKRWAGTRSEKTLMSQAEMALASLEAQTLERVAEVSPEDIRFITRGWYQAGLSPATINKRLNCLSAMGISVEGCRVKEPKVLKWWLRPEREEEVRTWCVAQGWRRLSDLIFWTTHTGLRIEESLRLDWDHFAWNFAEVEVPGTKTEAAHATLALGMGMRSHLMEIHTRENQEDGPFPLTYEQAHEGWQQVREQFGFTEPTATLKALRRSAARYLHYDCGMPLDMVRQYLRHENIETTMGYLRLTGGVSLDEQRRYLK